MATVLLLETAIVHGQVRKESPVSFSSHILIKKKKKAQSSHRGPAEINLTSIHEDAGLIPDLAQWVKDPALPRAVV